MTACVCDQYQLALAVLDVIDIVGQAAIEDLVQAAYERDDIAKAIIEALEAGDNKLDKKRIDSRVSKSDCTFEDGILLIYSRVYVLNVEDLREIAIRTYYNDPTAGYPSREKTYDLLYQQFYQPNAYNDVRRYVNNYTIYRRVKAQLEGY